MGRKEEARLLNEAMTSSGSEMIAIIGRRRVGKTYLIRHVFGEYFDFEITELQQSTTALQLEKFCPQTQRMGKTGVPYYEDAKLVGGVPDPKNIFIRQN